jgi:hypothetical protein
MSEGVGGSKTTTPQSEWETSSKSEGAHGISEQGEDIFSE